MEKVITCFFIRHGKTPGNLEKRYIGVRSDESLSEEGIAELRKLASDYSRLISENSDKKLYLSGTMKRCRETMELLFEDTDYIVIPDLTEIDFGDFEGHNYSELSGNEDYQRWIDSNGTISFPNGESREAFISRTYSSISKCIREFSTSLVVVCHGGNIMAFLSEVTGKDYFDFMCDPGDGYEVEIKVTEDSIDAISYHRISDRLHS